MGGGVGGRRGEGGCGEEANYQEKVKITKIQKRMIAKLLNGQTAR